ncbi:C4-dicarboxylate ABC transporter [Enterovibrio norvegicus FF-33]|uniref:TRAP transporter small permease protein n=2 Tax=Vibrionaceae TaxID=641 RepID=A0A1E5CA60_9GAMM|nr:C4-dicarboxylate ABC transporter [Enterovibrio norvegicus FF-454]OEE67098.1 C4-dicarboxylate ABC transporter [Enterovibrio norvegicus FF-33]OEE88835.1 C4-dicarboxylate ABC transporter [Enterovibrio norvegicus FF-162]
MQNLPQNVPQSVWQTFWQRMDKFESYACQALLCLFVTLLFIQVILRVAFNYGIPWSEELSRFAFVWFVFLGASYAARLAAHNRVTFHLKMLPTKVRTGIELIADMLWIAFNTLMTTKSIEVIESLMEYKFMSPALDWSMAYLYWIFPISFTLTSIRIIQVNYLKLVKGVEFKDVDDVQVD